MYVRSVQIKNLRAFREGTLEFLYPGRKLDSDPFISVERQNLTDPRHRNINVVLGSNGSGKSTVLDAIALAIISPMSQTGFVPQALIRRTKRSQPTHSSIGLEFVAHSTDTSQIAAKKSQIAKLDCTVQQEGNYEFLKGPPPGDELYKDFFLNGSPAFFVLGYGVFRRIDPTTQNDMHSRTIRQPRYDRVVTLFDDNVPLIALSNWFPYLEIGQRRSEVISLINKATPKTVRFDGNKEMMFRYRGLELPFAALSDGYRGHLGWLGDMLYRMHEVTPPEMKLTDLPGVVLVDEIDAHLHPVWQQEIISALSRTFPRIQFIFTTHSPLITGTLERSNINVISRTGVAAPVVSPPDEEMYGLSADQILMGDLFGLNTTRDHAFTKELRALETKAASGNADASVEFIRKAAIGKAAENYPKSAEREIPDWLRKMAAKQ